MLEQTLAEISSSHKTTSWGGLYFFPITFVRKRETLHLRYSVTEGNLSARRREVEKTSRERPSEEAGTVIDAIDDSNMGNWERLQRHNGRRSWSPSTRKTSGYRKHTQGLGGHWTVRAAVRGYEGRAAVPRSCWRSFHLRRCLPRSCQSCRPRSHRKICQPRWRHNCPVTFVLCAFLPAFPCDLSCPAGYSALYISCSVVYCT